MNDPHPSCDTLIIGAGAAGLMLALQLAEQQKVILVCKEPAILGNSYYAQGGIAAVCSEYDHIDSHVRDTLNAGAGLSHPDVAREIITEGRAIIHDLQNIGIRFDQHNEQLHLTQEGGHSMRRIAHAQDATGRAISESLQQAARQHPNIDIRLNHAAISLIRRHKAFFQAGVSDACLGAYILQDDGQILPYAAKNTVLATGGAGKVYRYTSNPAAATGDGIALAWYAGCRIMNMEFMQFHPTCLYHPLGQQMLLSEALRGEGALLLNDAGQRFVFEHDVRGELAPRDIVARAIDYEMKRQGSDCVYLDARPIGKQRLSEQFPNITKRLKELGLNLFKETIPVVPAAHYSCGGILSASDGQTDLAHLFAIGETACTGFHGANRLASNSLLECLAMAKLCGQTISTQTAAETATIKLPAWDDSATKPPAELIQLKHNWSDVRSLMSHYVGIVRSQQRLHEALRRLRLIHQETEQLYRSCPITLDLLELRHIVCVSELIIRSALQRQESRGLHYSLDFPNSKEQAKDTILNLSTIQ